MNLLPSLVSMLWMSWNSELVCLSITCSILLESGFAECSGTKTCGLVQLRDWIDNFFLDWDCFFCLKFATNRRTYAVIRISRVQFEYLCGNSHSFTRSTWNTVETCQVPAYGIWEIFSVITAFVDIAGSCFGQLTESFFNHEGPFHYNSCAISAIADSPHEAIGRVFLRERDSSWHLAIKFEFQKHDLRHRSSTLTDAASAMLIL